MDDFWKQILAFTIAFIPGVLIALLADNLNRRRETLKERRVNENARTLLALEVSANLNALKDFWQTINGLDTEHQAEGAEVHFAAMAQNGLLGYTVPRWSAVRWEHLAPQTAGALEERDIFSLTRVYAGLQRSPTSTARSSRSPTTSVLSSTASGSGTIALPATASVSSSGSSVR